MFDLHCAICPNNHSKGKSETVTTGLGNMVMYTATHDCFSKCTCPILAMMSLAGWPSHQVSLLTGITGCAAALSEHRGTHYYMYTVQKVNITKGVVMHGGGERS